MYSTSVQKEGQGSQTQKMEKVPSFDEAAENMGAELKAPIIKQEPLQVRGKYILYSHLSIRMSELLVERS